MYGIGTKPRLLAACAAIAAFCVSQGAGSAEAPTAATRADELTAAYLFNFAKLVEWPPAALGDTLNVCFVGAGGVREAFARSVADKHVGARRIVVRAADDSVQRSDCGVLYFEASLAPAGSLSPAGAAWPTLTVSDAPSFVARGGMIELFSEGNRLRFNINLDSAQHAGLRISSNLLQLAVHVNKAGS